MKRSLYLLAALLPAFAAAQTVSTQPTRQRPGSAPSVESRETRTRDGSNVENARQQQEAAAPGKSENAKGKKGEAPGQAKKSQGKKK